jgi:hypothetical protein
MSQIIGRDDVRFLAQPVDKQSGDVWNGFREVLSEKGGGVSIGEIGYRADFEERHTAKSRGASATASFPGDAKSVRRFM